MRYIATIMLVVVSVIHLLPLTGVLGPERLTELYGISFSDPNLEIVMRHRAVLFGLIGAFLLYAAFQPSVRLLAFIAAFVSVASFLWLAWSVGNYNTQLGRVFTADIIALACLVIGFGAHVLTGRQA
ncbi:MAG: phosphopantetheine adenylyltransferase [Blastocatellales bacterium]